MVPLHQPKWRKFLSLKSQRNTLPDEPTASTQSNDSVQRPDVAAIESIVVEAATPQKKRKRSEEEIALRKAKKFKSKNREGQEWKQLTDDHQNQQSKALSGQETSEPKVDENNKDQLKTDPDSTGATAALLSAKAKEIVKSRKDEKSQEKQKRPKKVVGESAALDRKAGRVFEYLQQYQAHVENGSEWKFKKQHQNWIVKHLYSYPWKSDDLVIQYLKTVQGQARKRLIERASEVKDENERVYGEDIIRRAENIILALKE